MGTERYVRIQFSIGLNTGPRRVTRTCLVSQKRLVPCSPTSSRLVLKVELKDVCSGSGRVPDCSICELYVNNLLNYLLVDVPGSYVSVLVIFLKV